MSVSLLFSQEALKDFLQSLTFNVLVTDSQKEAYKHPKYHCSSPGKHECLLMFAANVYVCVFAAGGGPAGVHAVCC